MQPQDKRQLYLDAVHWIAHNDGAGDDTALDPDAVQDQLTVLLVADTFGKHEYVVATDVVEVRNAVKEGK